MLEGLGPDEVVLQIGVRHLVRQAKTCGEIGEICVLRRLFLGEIDAAGLAPPRFPVL